MGLNNLQTGGTGGISPGGLRNLTEVSAIPDSAITSFESSNWADDFDGTTSGYTRVDTNPFDGSWNIDADAAAYDIIAFSTSELSQSDGYVFHFYEDKNSTIGEGGPVFVNSNGNGYMFRDNGPSNGFRLTEVTSLSLGSDLSTLSSSHNLPSDGYYELKVTVNGNSFEVEYLDLDGNTIEGPFTVSDSTYSQCNRIGLTMYRSGMSGDLLEATKLL